VVSTNGSYKKGWGSNDPVLRKTTSLFFRALDNNCISCDIFVICAMLISVVKIFDSQ
jgi:hypothetical protein